MFTLKPRDVNCNLVSSATSLTPEELKAAELKANPVHESKPRANPKGKH
jgi:hypothetical protein